MICDVKCSAIEIRDRQSMLPFVQGQLQYSEEFLSQCHGNGKHRKF